MQNKHWIGVWFVVGLVLYALLDGRFYFHSYSSIFMTFVWIAGWPVTLVLPLLLRYLLWSIVMVSVVVFAAWLAWEDLVHWLTKKTPG